MYGWENWTIKKAEHWRIDAFELWCWRRLLRVPWTARRSNQSILKEISPGCSLEGLMLKLKLQYFGHLMQRTDSLEKTLMLGKIEGRRRRGQRRRRGLDGSPTRWTWVWVNSESWWWTGRPGVLQLMGSQRVGHDWVTKLNWTELESPSGDAGRVRVVSSVWHGSGDRCWSSWARQTCSSEVSSKPLLQVTPRHHQGGRQGKTWASMCPGSSSYSCGCFSWTAFSRLLLVPTSTRSQLPMRNPYFTPIIVMVNFMCLHD